MPRPPYGVWPGRGEGEREVVRVCSGEYKPLGYRGNKVGVEPSEGVGKIEARRSGQVSGQGGKNISKKRHYGGKISGNGF